MSSLIKKKKPPALKNAFYALELLDEGGESQSWQPSGIYLSNYTIDYAQFCHQPLTHVALDFIVTTLKVPEFLFVRVPHKVVDKVKELSDEEPTEIIPGLPSGHHRFIRFRTEQYHSKTKKKVWGTMERLGTGVVCALYDSESASVRSGARVTQTGFLPFSDQLEMYTRRINVDKVFRDIGGGWHGDYHLTDNNCIHYALECWERLGGKASWNDVVDAHDAFIPGDHDAAGRDCSIM